MSQPPRRLKISVLIFRSYYWVKLQQTTFVFVFFPLHQLPTQELSPLTPPYGDEGVVTASKPCFLIQTCRRVFRCIYLRAGLGHTVVGDAHGDQADVGDRSLFDELPDASQPLAAQARLQRHTNAYGLALAEQLVQQLSEGAKMKGSRERDVWQRQRFERSWQKGSN